MPRKPIVHDKTGKNTDVADDVDISGFEDDEPIPARRDVRIFHRDKDDKNNKDDKDNKKDDDFEEDVFV
jgi:hypothetical protein